MQGELIDVSVCDLLRYTATAAKTTCILLEDSRDARCAALFVNRGEPVHAELGELEGEGVFGEVMAWTEGRFALDSQLEPRTRSVHRSMEELLLRQTLEPPFAPPSSALQEARREILETPPESAADWSRRLSQRAQLLASEPSALTASHIGPEEPEPSTQDLDLNLQDLAAGWSPEQILSELSSLPGVLGAVMVADEGPLLGHSLSRSWDTLSSGATGFLVSAIGNAAHRIGQQLGVGQLTRATVDLDGRCLLVLPTRGKALGMLLINSAEAPSATRHARALLDA